MGLLIPTAKAPIWTRPATPGLLSNFVQDTLTIRHDPGLTNSKIGIAAVTAVRQSDGETLWDSGWVGTPSAAGNGDSIPGLTSGGVGQGGFVYQPATGMATYFGGFVKPILGTRATDRIKVSKFSGPSNSRYTAVGKLPAGAPTYGMACCTAVVNGVTYVYLLGGNIDAATVSTQVWFAVLFPDGSVGPWTAGVDLPAARTGGAACTSGGMIYFTGGNTDGGGTTPVTTVYYATFNADGSIGAWTTGGALATAVSYHNALIFGTCFATFGGLKAAAAIMATTQKSTLAAGIPGAWANSTALNTAMFASCLVTWPSAGTSTTKLCVMMVGGFAAGPAKSAVVQQTSITGTTIAAFTGSTAVGNVQAFGYGAVVSSHGQLWLTVVGGATGTLGGMNGETNSIVLATDALTGAWASNSAGAALATGSMGTGGSVVTNGNGTQDITFAVNNGFGVAGTTPFLGDQVSFVFDGATITGAPLPTSQTTVINFGDAPTVTPTNSPANDGEPTVSFVFNQGAGGQGQKQYQIQVMDGATVLADSGVKLDNLDTQNLVPNPPFVSLHTYKSRVIAQSLDQPMPGSTASVQTDTNYTPTLTPPANPTLFVVTPDLSTAIGAKGSLLITWTNAANTVGNHIWYKKNGDATWILLRTLELTAGAQSVTLMDQIPIGVAYDYCITAFKADHSETTLASVQQLNVTTALPKDLASASGGSRNVCLHIPTTLIGDATHFVNLIVPLSAHFKRVVEKVSLEMVGATSPSTRYGTLNYLELDLSGISFPTAADRLAFDTLLSLAQSSDYPIYYRDVQGNITPCDIGNGRDWDWNGGPEIGSLTLTQTNWTYTP